MKNLFFTFLFSFSLICLFESGTTSQIAVIGVGNGNCDSSKHLVETTENYMIAGVGNGNCDGQQKLVETINNYLIAVHNGGTGSGIGNCDLV